MDYLQFVPKLIFVLSGFFILLLPSLIYHLLVFGRIFTFKSLVYSTTVSMFVTFFLLILSSILGTFYALPLFIFIIIIIYYFSKSSTFKLDESAGKSNLLEISLILVSTILLYLFLISPQLDSFHNLLNYRYSIGRFNLYQIYYAFSDGDDTIYAYIPWSEILSSLHYLPGFSLHSPFYSISYISGGYVLIGYLLGLFGDFGIYAVAGIPLYFIFITQLILVAWLKEYKLNSYYWLAIGLLFAAPQFFSLQTMVIRETYLIPFIILAFYNIFLYIKYKSIPYLYLALFSLTLIASIRDTVLILILTMFISFILVFGYPCVKKIYSQIGLLKLMIIFLPVIAWYIRNIYYYRNPAYILFQHIFGNDLVLSVENPDAPGFISYILETGYHNNINFLYPSLFLGIIYLIITSKKDRFNRFIIFSIVLYIAIFFSLTPVYNDSRYYLHLFNALLVFFSTLAIIKIITYLKIQKNFDRANINHILYTIIFFLLVGIIGYGMFHSEPTYEAKCCFTDMLTLDESIQDGTVLIFNSDRI
jgi:hypothetical protein